MPNPRRLPPSLFPIALWFVAVFFLLGDLGKWLDDWYYLQRDPATGAIQSLFENRPLHFFRPLYRLVVPALQTLLWKADWLNHLISATAHGCAAFAFFRLLVACRISRTPAAMAALLFLVHPVHMEVVFWSCALPTILSTLLCLWALLLMTRWVASAQRWAPAAISGAMFLAAACLNEQATMLLAALPAVALAARPDDVSVRGAIWRSILPTIAGGTSLALYVCGHAVLHFAPPAVGQDAMLAPATAALSHAGLIVRQMPMRFLLTHSYNRAWRLSLSTIREFPVRAAFAGLVLALSFPAWARWCGATPPRGPGAPRAATLGLVSVAMFVAPLLPIAALTYWITWRVFYVPMLGLCAAVAVAGHGAGLVLPSRPRWRSATTAACSVSLLLLSILGIGFQRGFHNRDRADAAILARLRALVPNPDPDSVFIVARLAVPPTGPRNGDFDLFFRSVLGSRWSARWALGFAYARDDLRAAAPTSRGQWGTAISGADESNLITTDFGPVPWAKAIPLVVSPTNEVFLVTQIEAPRAGAAPQRYRVPQTAALAAAGAFPDRVFILQPPPGTPK